MQRAIVITLIAVVVVVAILAIVRPTRGYLKREYSMLLWTGLVGLIGTFLGVSVAFHLESKRQIAVEQSVFQHRLISLLYETVSNIRNIKDMRTGFTPAGVNIKHLRSNVAEELLGDPMTYKHGARGLFEATWIMVDAIETYNRQSDFAHEHFERHGMNTPKTLDEIRGALDQAEYRIRTVQKVLDIYNVQHFQTIVWKEPAYEQIYNLVHGEKDFSAELEKIRQADEPD